jgi:hypothetical protein
MIQRGIMLAVAVALSATGSTAHGKMVMQTFPVLAGAGVHDVYPAPDGSVWFTARSGGSPKSGPKPIRNGVPLWTETACRFPPKPPAGLNRNRLSETPKLAKSAGMQGAGRFPSASVSIMAKFSPALSKAESG